MNSTRKIPFARVVCDGSELALVQEVLASGWLTTAGKAMEFERRFSAAVGAKYACAVNSCTAALHLALEAVGVGAGDEVLVPTLTFTATAEIIRYLGADPVFADVEYGTGLLTPEIVEAALKAHPKIKAVMVVHFAGQAAQMQNAECRMQNAAPITGGGGEHRTSNFEHSTLNGGEAEGDEAPLSTLNPQPSTRHGILEVCHSRGVKVIEDAAHAFPTRLNGRMVGSFGDVTCFSFYANKTITTGEGGMLVTDDEAIYARAKVMRLHGIDRDIWNRFTSDKPSWEYDVVAPGFKYNMPDINAAIGLAQLERAEQMRKDRQRCFEFYLRELADCEFLDLPVIRAVSASAPQLDGASSVAEIPKHRNTETPSPGLSTLNPQLSTPFQVPRLSTLNPQLSTSLNDHSCHLFWIVLKPGASVTRNRFIELLAEAGIGTSVHYKPLHRMTYYRERYGLKSEDFQNAEKHWQGCVSLPVYPSLSNQELAYVVAQVKRCMMGEVLLASP